MRISNLQKPVLITEGWNDPRLTLLEERTIVPFIRDIEKYISEAKLTPDQIQQLFKNVEQGATSAGGNRTAIGKGADAASFIADKMKELKNAVANSGPVQNVDAKFNELKAKIGEKDSKVVQGIKVVSDWAKENPGKASVAVAILTVAAGMAGGPLGGAIGGFLARATKDLLKGENLSTAIGKSMKTAAVGAIVGVIADNIDFTDPPFEGGPNEVSVELDGETTLEKLAAQAGKDSEIATQVSADPENAAEIAFGEISVESFKAQYAEELLKRQVEKFGGEVDVGMMNKIADSITIEGSYPDNFKAGFDGSFVRGNIYLTPEEAKALSQAGFKGMDILGPEATEWMKENVEGASSYFDTASRLAAEKAEAVAAEYNAMSAAEQQAYDAKQEKVADLIGDEYTPPGEPKYDTDAGASSNAKDDFKGGNDARDEFAGGNDAKDDFKGGNDAKDDFKGGNDARDDDAFQPGSKPDNFDELSPEEKGDVLLNVPPGQWTDEDFAMMKDQNLLGPQDAQTYFANNPDKIPDDAKSSMSKMRQFLSSEIGPGFEDANLGQQNRVARYLLRSANESFLHTGQKLSEGQVYLLINRLVNANNHMLENNLMFESAFAAISYYHRNTRLDEGPMDALKKAGSAIKKGAQAVGKAMKPGLDVAKGAIKGAAKQVTTKVTAEKINSAWKKAGSPTDSDEIYDIIKGLGVGDDVIKGTYDSMQIKPPAGTEEPANDTAGVEEPTDASTPTDDTATTADEPAQGELDFDAEPKAQNDGPTDPELEKQIGDAKQDAAAKKGRGLSPEEEAQVEKEVTDKFEKSKPATDQGDKLPSADEVDNTDEFGKGDAGDNTKEPAQDGTGSTQEPAQDGTDSQGDTQQPNQSGSAETPATTGGTAQVDLNKLASDIKKAGKPVVDAVKQKLTA